MSDEQKRAPGGSAPRAGTVAVRSLGSVRVTDAELALYGQAAAAAGVTRADWIRGTLERAARRALRAK